MDRSYIDYFVNYGVNYSHRKQNIKRFNWYKDARLFFNSVQSEYKELIRIKSSDWEVLSEIILKKNY